MTFGSAVGALVSGLGVAGADGIGTAAFSAGTESNGAVSAEGYTDATAEPPATGPAPAASQVPATGLPTGTGAVGGLTPSGPAPRQGLSTAQPATSQTTAGSAAEAAVLVLVNQERAKVNCPALSTDPRLAVAARAHSADMAGRGYFAHDTPDGVNVGTRVTRAGYRFSAVGENIAKGQRDAAAVMKAWMNSPGHRANILNCRFRDIGIGLARQGSTPLWTQDFGTPR